MASMETSSQGPNTRSRAHHRRSSSREEPFSLEERMDRMEEAVERMHEAVEGMDTRMVELESDVEGLRGEFQRALNEGLDKLSKESSERDDALQAMVVALRREVEELPLIVALRREVEELKEELERCKTALGRGKGHTPKERDKGEESGEEDEASEGGSRRSFSHRRESSRRNGDKDKKPLACFLCEGPHRVRDCPKRSKLSAIAKEDPQSENEREILRLGAIKLSVGPRRQQEELTSEDESSLGEEQALVEAHEVLGQGGDATPKELPRDTPPEGEVDHGTKLVSEAQPLAEAPSRTVLSEIERPKRRRRRRRGSKHHKGYERLVGEAPKEPELVLGDDIKTPLPSVRHGESEPRATSKGNVRDTPDTSMGKRRRGRRRDGWGRMTRTKAFRRIRKDMPWSLERPWGDHKAWEMIGPRFPIIWALNCLKNMIGPRWPARGPCVTHDPARGTGHRSFQKLPDGSRTSQHRAGTRPAPAKTGWKTLEASSKVQHRPKCAREV
ncbi:hypothetical protein COLO4_07731 [Corchorus olitorius]|uniref:Uncharacterized protein n=1 Tax=Corchorus olitorius TaxID=93759 RepID=A0A1R3KIT7_9ROSI|nr:hypothetical protein COLO4_07731 [Corchorus olitorius]